RVVNPYPNRRVGIPCRARPDGKQQTPSEKMKMPRDAARVRSFSKKASSKQSTIKCVRHPGRTRKATNQSHNSRARAAVISVTSPVFLRSRPWYIFVLQNLRVAVLMNNDCLHCRLG